MQNKGKNIYNNKLKSILRCLAWLYLSFNRLPIGMPTLDVKNRLESILGLDLLLRL